MSANAAEKPTKKERTMKKTKRNKGFTLVELVIVIAVIAILAAVLIPTFVTVVDNANKSAALQEATNLKTEILTLYEGNFDEYCKDFTEKKRGTSVTTIASNTTLIIKDMDGYNETSPSSTFGDFIHFEAGKIEIKYESNKGSINFTSDKGVNVTIKADTVLTGKDATPVSSAG